MRMLALVVISITTAIVLAAILLGQRRDKNEEPEIDSERSMRVGIELHGIRRRLNVAWTRSHMQRDAEVARRDLDGLLDALDRRSEERW